MSRSTIFEGIALGFLCYITIIVTSAYLNGAPVTIKTTIKTQDRLVQECE